MNKQETTETLQRIQSALEAARGVLSRFTAGAIEAEYKAGHDPVTEADKAVDEVLRRELLREGEGWLSEETIDDHARLDRSRVWVVDPLDGTREFVAGIPEFCVSVAMVEDGKPVCGGICNPATNETVIGSVQTGVLYNGQPAKPTGRTKLEGSLILASRSEMKRGEWKKFEEGDFQIRPMGSVAYKLSLVASGKADITFTLVPKNEWDVAAGAALCLASGAYVRTLDGQPLVCNQKNPLLSGLIACAPGLTDQLLELVGDHLPAGAARAS
jgi:myo-inositol-1(or 4)-monophosphatase